MRRSLLVVVLILAMVLVSLLFGSSERQVGCDYWRNGLGMCQVEKG